MKTRNAARQFLKACLFLTALFFVCVSSFSAASDSDKLGSETVPTKLSPSAILDRIEENMKGINDLQARMTFRIFIKKLGFPFSVNADYYFKAPDKVKLALRGLPGLLMGDAPKTITAATTLTGFRKDFQSLYNAKLLGIRKLQGRSCYYLELTPIREDGNVSKTLLWINQDDYTLPRLVTDYKDGSWIQVNRTYAPIDHHRLVDRIDATMNFVKNNLQADVTARYQNYKINQGIDDKIFKNDG